MEISMMQASNSQSPSDSFDLELPLNHMFQNTVFCISEQCVTSLA